MKALFFLLCFILAWCHSCLSQEHTAAEELRFAQYLIDNKQYNDAVYILKGKLASKKSDAPASDSLNYFLGWSYYNLKSLDSSSKYFSRVSGEPFYNKSVFYSAFNLAYGKRTEEARASLNPIAVEKDSSLARLKNLELAGIALLEKDYLQYEALAKKFSYKYFAISEEEKQLGVHYLGLKKIRKKSPLLAGVMSAIIPGSGKMYAGYTGQGIAAFLTVGVLGASAAECYSKLGYKSPHFIALGSIFAVFYAGNIWGSTLSVKLAREHREREIQDDILFNLQIPLRRIFN